MVAAETGSTGVVNISGATSSIILGGDGRLMVGRGGNGTVNQSGGTVQFAGWSAISLDAGTGVYNLSGGNLISTTNDDFFVGRVGNGTLAASGTGAYVGLSNAANTDPGARGGSRMNVGQETGSVGTISLAGASSISVNSLSVGSNGQATVNQTGGTLNVGQWAEIGTNGVADTAGNVATYNISGGTLNAQQLVVGTRRKGQLNLSGTGTINLGSDGTVNVNGWGDFAIGRDGGGSDHGNGILIQTGGTINSYGKNLNIGQNTNTTGLYSISNGTLNLNSGGGNQDINVSGGAGTGTFNMTGTAVVNGLNQLNIANGAGGNGFVTVDGAGLSLTANGESHIGNNGTGTLIVKNGAGVHFNGGWSAKVGTNNGSNGTLNVESGGQVTGNSWLVIAAEGGSTGTVNMSGASSAITLGGDGRFFVGRAGNALFNQLNGAVTIAGFSAIGLDASGVGVYNMTGGSLTGTTNDDFVVGNDGSGTLNMGAGNINIPQQFRIAGNGGSTGTVNLLGGVITAGYLQIGGGTASVSLNGGTLRGNQNQGDFLRNFNPGNTLIGTNGVTFDSNTFNLTVQSVLAGVAGDGGLKKIGNGTLALTAANLYTGGTVINAGTLNINADAALGGVTGGVAINNNAILQAAANVTTNRTITLGAGGGQIDTNGQIVTLDTGSTVTGTSLTEAGSGVLNIKGVQTYNALTTTGGVTNIYTALGTGTSTITANATTNIYASQTLASLTIADGVEVTFGNGLPFDAEPPKAAAPFRGGSAGLVPEPGSIGLLLVGALGILARRRRTS